MPKLIALYIRSIAIGFALALVFLGGVLALDIAGLRGLIFGSSMGMVAAAMLVVFNGIVFSGVQFAIAVMKLAEPPEGPRGGTRAPVTRGRATGRATGLVPVPVKVTQAKRGKIV